MFKIAVLMSTYNGEKYIQQQIESIFQQEYVDITLYIRDDNSTDNTIKIIEELKEKYKIILVKDRNANIGPAKSFMKIINVVEPFYDYYSFSDQDDVWEKNKIISAIKEIEKYDSKKSIVYGGNYKLFYNSNIIKNNYLDIKLDFYSTLIRNKIAGCTMVFNSTLLKELKKYTPNYIEMHDVWVLKVCQSIDGICIYDKNAYILYRQHDKNVMGAGNTLKAKIKARLRRKNVCSNTALEILNGYKEQMVDFEKIKILEQLKIYKKDNTAKLSLFFNNRIKSEKLFSTMLFKLGILFNFE